MKGAGGKGKTGLEAVRDHSDVEVTANLAGDLCRNPLRVTEQRQFKTETRMQFNRKKI